MCSDLTPFLLGLESFFICLIFAFIYRLMPNTHMRMGKLTNLVKQTSDGLQGHQDKRFECADHLAVICVVKIDARTYYLQHLCSVELEKLQIHK